MKQENTIYFEAKGKKITKIRSLGEIEQRARQELWNWIKETTDLSEGFIKATEKKFKLK